MGVPYMGVGWLAMMYSSTRVPKISSLSTLDFRIFLLLNGWCFLKKHVFSQNPAELFFVVFRGLAKILILPNEIG